MIKTASADIVIFGGGVAGLWLLNRIRQSGLGLSVILLESTALGGSQTRKSQGILHGGMKYALQGVVTSEAKALSEMPGRWQACLQGQGEIDLSAVPVLSNHQYLWSPQKIAAKIAGFLASTALHGNVQSLSKMQYPSVFNHPLFKGEVFSLDEMVIDVHALLRELVKLNQDAVFKIEPLCEEELRLNEKGELQSVTVYMGGKALEIEAQKFVFTAGSGNEVIVKKLHRADLQMQRRPLHMVLVRTPFSYPLFAHCMGLGNKPRLTITTHGLHDGDNIWYLGGNLAEEGVHRNSETQIAFARAELASLFPWLDFGKADFKTFMIDRAEPLQKNGNKPDSAYLKEINNILVGWPNKLVLAPYLADKILMLLQQNALQPKFCDLQELRAWPMPPIAQPVWEEAFCKVES